MNIQNVYNKCFICIFEGGIIKKIKFSISPRKRKEKEFFRKLRETYPIVDYHYKEKRKEEKPYEYIDFDEL